MQAKPWQLINERTSLQRVESTPSNNSIQAEWSWDNFSWLLNCCFLCYELVSYFGTLVRKEVQETFLGNCVWLTSR